MTTMKSLARLPLLPASPRGWLHLLLNASAIVMALSFLAWPALAAQPRALQAGLTAPDFHAVTFDDAGLQMSAYGDRRPVLLVFYDLDCPPSYRTLARLNDLAAARPDVAILAVNGKAHPLPALRALVEAATINAPADRDDWKFRDAAPRREWQALADPDARVARLYHVPDVFPAFVFVDQAGRVAAVRVGEHAGANLLYRLNEILPAQEAP